MLDETLTLVTLTIITVVAIASLQATLELYIPFISRAVITVTRPTVSEAEANGLQGVVNVAALEAEEDKEAAREGEVVPGEGAEEVLMLQGIPKPAKS